MKEIIFYLLTFLNIACAVAQTNNKETEANFKKIEWVLGKWNLINSKPGIHGTEYWSKISALEFKGTGITWQGRDTVSVEKIRIVKKDNDIFYVAELKENPAPVYFKFTKITEHEFACENPEHDFPKKIIYKLEGHNLKATISGGKKSIDYLFKKIKA